MPDQQQQINYGAAPNDGQGDPLRDAFIKTDDNFDAIWAAGPVGSNITILNNNVAVVNTNGNLVLQPNGVGVIQANASIVPNSANIRDLGSADRRWRRVYLQTLNTVDYEVEGDLTVSGNLTIQGDTIQIGNLVTDAKTLQLSNTAANAAQAAGSGITVGASDDIATLLYDSGNNTWDTNIGFGISGNVTADYFIGDGSALTGLPVPYTDSDVTALLSSGNVSTDIFTQGNVEAAYILGNGSQLTGLPEQYGNANVANLLADFGSNNIVTTGNISGGQLEIAPGGGNAWTISGQRILAPSGGEWRSEDDSLDDFITSAPDGYINIQSLYADGNIASELKLEHGVARLVIADAPFAEWTFNTTGQLDVPGDIVPDANGVYNLGSESLQWANLWIANNTIYLGGVALGISAGNVLTVNGNTITGNVTFSGEAVIGTGTSNTQSGLYLAPDPGSLANDLYLRVRGNIQDEPTHIHFDTGNNQYYNLIIGDDNKYVQLANTGNIVIRTDDYAGNTAQWTFGTDGNLTLPYGATIRDTAGNAVAIGLNAGLTNQNDFAVAIGPGAGEISQGFNAVAVGFGAGANAQGSGAVSVGVGAGFITQGDSTVAIGASAGYQAQAVYAVAIGLQAGQTSQAQDAIAIGRDAGKTSQGEIAVAIGFQAGANTQGNNAIAIGESAGALTQGVEAIAIGYNAGANTQGSRAVAISIGAGQTGQGGDAIAIGYNAGTTSQGNAAVAIGQLAGETSQNGGAVAIGYYAGLDSQSISAVAIGSEAGQTNQGQYAVAIGDLAGNSSQGNSAVAIGDQAGETSQGDGAVAIGSTAGLTVQGNNAVAIGSTAGNSAQGISAVAIGAFTATTSQGARSVAIGQSSGQTTQGTDSVAIGQYAGNELQGINAVAIGNSAGYTSQGNRAVAIGLRAGTTSQGVGGIAIGEQAGHTSQGVLSVAIGYYAGANTQSFSAVAIGAQAGETAQGSGAIAIGDLAGRTNQANNSIILNATGANLDQTTANTFTVAPVRNDVANVGEVVFYNTSSKEITYGNTISVAGNVSAARLQNDGNLEVRSNVAGTVKNWTFDTLGDLNLPAGGNIGGSGGISANNITLTGSVNTGGNVNFTSAEATDTARIFADVAGSTTSLVLEVGDDDSDAVVLRHYSFAAGNTIDMLTAQRSSATAANVTVTGNFTATGNVAGNVAGFAIGYRDIPQVSFTGNATIATGDAGKHFYSTQSSNYILTIANNASQGFQTGAAMTIVNQGTGNITVAQGSGVTLYLAGNVTSGNRTVATFGMATIMKVATDTWFINGTGVS